jgi:hypothetical protein
MADTCARALEIHCLPDSPTSFRIAQLFRIEMLEGPSKGEHVGLVYYIVCGKAEDQLTDKSSPPQSNSSTGKESRIGFKAASNAHRVERTTIKNASSQA